MPHPLTQLTGDFVRAEFFRDSLAQKDPARAHLTILIDMVYAFSRQHAEDSRTISRLINSKADQVARRQETTQRIALSMPHASFDANGAPL